MWKFDLWFVLGILSVLSHALRRFLGIASALEKNHKGGGFKVKIELVNPESQRGGLCGSQTSNICLSVINAPIKSNSRFFDFLPLSLSTKNEAVLGLLDYH